MSQLVWSTSDNKLVSAPDEQLTDGVAQGQLAFRKGVRIPVVGPDGAQGTIDSSEAQQSFQQGWRFHTRAEQQAEANKQIEEIRAEAFDKPLAAGVIGAIRGGTFGGSDILASTAEQIGLAPTGTRDALLNLKEQNPVASTVGEIGGAIAGTVTGVGPAAWAARTGEATAAAVAGSGVARGLAGELVAKGAGSAIEGMAYGMGQVASEATLGDPNLTASKAAAEVGLSTIFGGVAGAGLNLLGKGATAAYNKTMGAVLTNGTASEIYGKVAAAAKGLEGEEKQRFVDFFSKANLEQRKQVAHFASNPDQLYDAGFQAIKGLNDAGKYEASIMGQVRELNKTPLAEEPLARLKFKQGTEMVDVPDVSNVSRDVVTPINDAMAKMTENPGLYKPGFAKVLETTKTQLADDLQNAVTKQDAFEAVQKARSVFNDFVKGLRSDPSSEAKATRSLLGDVYDGFGTHLKSEGNYGSYAKQFAEMDDAFHQYITYKGNFEKAFTTKVAKPYEGDVKVISQAKSQQFWKNPEGVSNALKSENLDNIQNAIQKMQDISTKYGVPPQIDMQQALQSMDTLKQLRMANLLLNRNMSHTGKILVGALVGQSLGEIGADMGESEHPGWVRGAGGLIGAAIANPNLAVRYLGKLERMGNAFDGKANSMLGRLLQTQTAKEAGSSLVSSTAANFSLQQLNEHLDGPGGTDHNKTLENIAPYINDPNLIDQRMGQNNPHLDSVAPQTYAALVNKSYDALNFLRTKWPQKDNTATVFTAPAKLSSSERMEMQVYANGAFNPGKLLDQIGQGRVDPRMVEAVRTVHPELYADLQKKLIEKIPEAKNVSHQNKLQISLAFGIPAVPGISHMATVAGIQPQMAHQAERPISGNLGGDLAPNSVRLGMR